MSDPCKPQRVTVPIERVDDWGCILDGSIVLWDNTLWLFDGIGEGSVARLKSLSPTWGDKRAPVDECHLVNPYVFPHPSDRSDAAQENDDEAIVLGEPDELPTHRLDAETLRAVRRRIHNRAVDGECGCLGYATGLTLKSRLSTGRAGRRQEKHMGRKRKTPRFKPETEAWINLLCRDFVIDTPRYMRGWGLKSYGIIEDGLGRAIQLIQQGSSPPRSLWVCNTRESLEQAEASGEEKDK